MAGRKKHLLNKVLIIIAVEALAIFLTRFVSRNFVVIPHTTVTLVIFGAITAYIVIQAYDAIQKKRHKKKLREIEELDQVALRRYEEKEIN